MYIYIYIVYTHPSIVFISLSVTRIKTIFIFLWILRDYVGIANSNNQISLALSSYLWLPRSLIPVMLSVLLRGTTLVMSH